MQNEQKIWDWFKLHSPFNDFAISGIMANIQGESAGFPNNLEDRANNKLNITDEQYTAAIDNNLFNEDYFATENGVYGGYGYFQWTEQSRSRKLYRFAKSTARSIGDGEMQLEFFMKEIQEDFRGSFNKLLSAANLLSAVTVVCEEYERPANPSAQTQKRYKYAEEIYARNHGRAVASKPTGTPTVSENEKTHIINILLDVVSRQSALIDEQSAIIDDLKEVVAKCQTL